MAGPITGETAQGINIADVSSAGDIGAINLSGTYFENKIFTRIEIDSDPVELDAAFARAKMVLIQELNKIGL